MPHRKFAQFHTIVPNNYFMLKCTTIPPKNSAAPQHQKKRRRTTAPKNGATPQHKKKRYRIKVQKMAPHHSIRKTMPHHIIRKTMPHHTTKKRCHTAAPEKIGVAPHHKATNLTVLGHTAGLNGVNSSSTCLDGKKRQYSRASPDIKHHLKLDKATSLQTHHHHTYMALLAPNQHTVKDL